VAGANRTPRHGERARREGARDRPGDAVRGVGVAYAGVTYLPLDDFSSYPAAGFGPTCRYGDYLASNFFNGHRYFATEDVHALTKVAGWQVRASRVRGHADAVLGTPEFS